MVDIDTIVQILEPAVSEIGLELYDVDLSGSGRARVLRVMVDRDGGVDLEAIAAATRRGVAAPGRAAARRGGRRPVRARGEQPGPRTSVAHAGALHPGDGGDHLGQAPSCRRPRRADACTASSPRPTTPASSSLLDDGSTERLAYDDLTQARTVFEWGPSQARRPSRRSPSPRSHSSRNPAPERTGTAMNSEMMEALENIEREKGISIEIMLEALANALLTAYKRMPDAAEEALVEIDTETGEIKVIAQELDEDGNVTREWDDTPTDFGRIAAQTAKQVIFQRIREAEREMKYEEYAGREGDIVTGIIQQTDARYTLLDLGKVEALLPQAEQVQNEHYDHGSRLKAYIVEVRKTAKGPQIVVSRTHPGLVKRLFELEVPEIVDGVVELKAIAREPGHRTKLAVVVNDNNVDPVGACVGPAVRACAWSSTSCAARRSTSSPTATTRRSS